MEQIAGQTAAAGWSATAAGIAILAIAVSLAALALLSMFSAPVRMVVRMVSEY
jgi:hypothetical protein